MSKIKTHNDAYVEGGIAFINGDPPNSPKTNLPLALSFLHGYSVAQIIKERGISVAKNVYHGDIDKFISMIESKSNTKLENW